MTCIITILYEGPISRLTRHPSRAIMQALFCTLQMELFMKSTILFRIVEFIFRIFGMIVFGFAGVSFGNWLASLFELPGSAQVYLYRWLFLLLGGLGGFILTPYFTTRPARAIRVKLGHLSAETLFAGLVGLIVGLLTAALLSFPFAQLPRPFGQILPFIGVIAFSYLGISLFVMRQGDIMGLFSTLSGRGESGSSSSWTNLNRTILLDTSVI